MRQYTIFVFILLGAMSCREKLYTEAIEVAKKHELTGVIHFPADQAILNSHSFRDGVNVKASVSSAAPLLECRWYIQSEHQREKHMLAGQGIIDGAKCQIEEALDGEKLIDGQYYFKVHAKNAAGLELSDVRQRFQVLKKGPAIEVISPSDGGFLSTDSIHISGSFNNSRNIREIRASFHGIGNDNQHLKDNAKASLGDTSWKITLGKELIAGEYALDLVVTDIYGNETVLPTKNIIIDHQPPKILGAIDGIPQRPYAEETINYLQKLVKTDNSYRYLIEPAAKATAINWQKVPTIYRWFARLDDLNTAPSYSVRVSDDNKLKEVRYKIAPKCSLLDESDLIAKDEGDIYDIRFTQSSMRYALTQNAERYCLSIWAIDQAGNASNNQVEFLWQVIAPPLSVDMNAARYRASNREDDISWIGPPVWTLFRRHKNPIELKKDVVVGHAILSNSFPAPLAALLKLNKPIVTTINKYEYQMFADFIDIKYYSYDLLKDEIGAEITLNDGSAIINAGEAILAKFILVKDMPLRFSKDIDSRFWEAFALEVGFAKTGRDRAMVGGLTLVTRDPNLGILINEFPVPWGAKHVLRRRTASRLAI